MSAHSVLPPSGLHQIIQCPGSVRMQRPYPETEDSKDAAEGTAAHWAMAELMASRPVRVGQQAANGILLDADMIEAAEMIVEDVRKTIAPHGLSLGDCATEVPVEISRVHPLCWGTPDIRVWLKPGLLAVWDLKYGHRFVSAFENPQLLAYSVGAASQAGLPDDRVQVLNRIVQPRSFHRDGPVREWSYRLHEVRGLINVASNAAHEALGTTMEPRTHVGPACRDCRARLACPTFLRAAQEACDIAGGSVPQDLPPAALGVELRLVQRAFDLLKWRKEALEEEVAARIRKGERIAHFRLVNGSGRQRWAKSDAEVIQLGKLLGINLQAPPSAITPTQALAAGLPAALKESFVAKGTGATTLEPDDGSEFRKHLYSQVS